MKYTLIIWAILNGFELYLVPNDQISKDHRDLLRDSNNKFINENEVTIGLRFISAAVTKDADDYLYDDPEDWKGIYVKYLTNYDLPIKLNITETIVTGYTV